MPDLNRYIIASQKKWHESLFDRLKKREGEEWLLVNDSRNFTLELLKEFSPKKIFLPHWSDLLVDAIIDQYECVIFHMTDLPFGRGGSPLQNLIVRGFSETKISAVRAVKILDAGDIYDKQPLSLKGTAYQIFQRAVPIIESMIIKIIDQQLIPVPQKGEVVQFERRKPLESNIKAVSTENGLYDYIRMLDCSGYPHAFLETEHFILYFTNATINESSQIEAHVKFHKK